MAHQPQDARAKPVSFRTKWIRALMADPTQPVQVMALAYTIHYFADANGCGVALSNEQIEEICGISRPTATKAKKLLRESGWVQLFPGNGNGIKTRFRMTIPEQEGATPLPLLEGKGETTEPESSFPLNPKGETSRQKGETSKREGATSFPLILDYPGVIQEVGEPYGGSPTSKREHQTDVVWHGGQIMLVNGTQTALLNKFPKNILDAALRKTAMAFNEQDPSELILGSIWLACGEIAGNDSATPRPEKPPRSATIKPSMSKMQKAVPVGYLQRAQGGGRTDA